MNEPALAPSRITVRERHFRSIEDVLAEIQADGLWHEVIDVRDPEPVEPHRHDVDLRMYLIAGVVKFHDLDTRRTVVATRRSRTDIPAGVRHAEEAGRTLTLVYAAAQKPDAIF